MTEAEWLACTDPQKMLGFLEGRASDRKLRLFACACCRHTWHLFSDHRVREAVEVAERLADGLATAEESQAAESAARAARRDADAAYQASDAAAVVADATAGETRQATAWAAVTAGAAAASAQGAIGSDAGFAARTAAAAAANTAEYAAAAAARTIEYTFRVRASGDEKVEQCRLCRCVFGPLAFRPVPPLAPALLTWNDATAVKLARAIYDGRRFEDLPILADALEEAGCTAAGLLGHLRGPGPHVRGCWALDRLLGRG
jgi:hypothetical protein